MEFHQFRRIARALRLPITLITVSLLYVPYGIKQGISGLKYRQAYDKPVTLTCKEFLEKKPRKGRYILNGCVVDLRESAFDIDLSSGKVGRVWVPVYPDSKPLPKQTALLLRTENSEICAIVDYLADAANNRQNPMYAPPQVVLLRIFQGMVMEAGEDPETKHAVGLKLTMKHLQPDYVTLVQGREPTETTTAYFMLGACAICLVLTVIGVVASAQYVREIYQETA
jgi:hypothetical protein